MASSSTTTLVQSSSSKKRAAPGGGAKAGWLTLEDGTTVNLKSQKSLEPTPELVAALVARVLELEADAHDTFTPAAKRARVFEGGDAAPKTASALKADQKRAGAKLKSFFDRVKKDCKSDAHKFKGGFVTLKHDDVLTAEDFAAVFAGKGTLVQPTPTNKPNSAVTIITYTQKQVEELFAGVAGIKLDTLKGNRWTQGGIWEGKAVKLGIIDVAISLMHVSYSKGTSKATVTFNVTPTCEDHWGW